ncbi:MAG TPA: hypothetical protein VKR58_14010 [Aquella sp.]|nr:hypothetical protein [Aquella sp.]
MKNNFMKIFFLLSSFVFINSAEAVSIRCTDLNLHFDYAADGMGVQYIKNIRVTVEENKKYKYDEASIDINAPTLFIYNQSSNPSGAPEDSYRVLEIQHKANTKSAHGWVLERDSDGDYVLALYELDGQKIGRPNWCDSKASRIEPLIMNIRQIPEYFRDVDVKQGEKKGTIYFTKQFPVDIPDEKAGGAKSELEHKKPPEGGDKDKK